MNSDFLGFADVDGTLVSALAIVDGAGAPVDPTNAPTYRVYDGGDVLATGVLSKLDTGIVANASDTTPIGVTATGHGLETGNKVAINGVAGNTAANGSFVVTMVDADHFTLNGSAGNGTATAPGTWHVLGLYQLSQSLLSSLGFESGKTYQVLVNWNDGSSDRVGLYTFGVL